MRIAVSTLVLFIMLVPPCFADDAPGEEEPPAPGPTITQITFERGAYTLTLTPSVGTAKTYVYKSMTDATAAYQMSTLRDVEFIPGTPDVLRWTVKRSSTTTAITLSNLDLLEVRNRTVTLRSQVSGNTLPDIELMSADYAWELATPVSICEPVAQRLSVKATAASSDVTISFDLTP